MIGYTRRHKYGFRMKIRKFARYLNHSEMLAAWFLFVAMVTARSVTAAPTTQSVDMLMPEVQPHKPDTYLCRSLEVAELKPYITGFIPNANMDIAHHILLYGCDKPGSQAEVWNCGEMVTTNFDEFEEGPVCGGEVSKILYAWAMDAPSLSLPKDVAFKLGEDTGIKTLAMQVHYKNVTSFLPPQNKKDSSGLTLVMTDEPKGRQAGVYLMVTGGVIPTGKIEYLETACPYPNADVEMHPFAFRTHTHPLGRVVAGYRVRDGQWTEIGRQDPRKPQMFYNVTNPGLTVRRGDTLVARCTMENNEDHDVRVGPTQKDEMCNFYIMYYVNGNKRLPADDCFSLGGPMWYLRDYADQEALNLPAMPDTISLVPGDQQPMRATTQGGHQEDLIREKAKEEEEVEEEEHGEEEEDNPVVDELLDEYLSRMDDDEVNALVSEVIGQQEIPYVNMPQYLPRARVNEAYPRYYYPEDTL